ncbi:MAG: DUF5132 domain-containing protein [Armatimonadota bacterium]
MALEDIGERLEGKGWIGVAIGTVVLAPVVFPALARGLRPAAKGAIKGYLALQERARVWAAETGEQFQDLVAEAKSEYAHPEGEMMTVAPAGENIAGAEGEAARAEGEAEGAKAAAARPAEEPAAGTPEGEAAEGAEGEKHGSKARHQRAA